MQQTRLQENVTAKATNQEDFIKRLLSEWQFYLPDYKVAERILHLNDEIGDEYFKERYRNISEKGCDDNKFKTADVEENDQINESLNDPSWHTRLLTQITSILFHGESISTGASDKENVILFSKYISERTYNHLAMLARSPHAQNGGAFSLWEDFGLEIAGKIGLGLYFSDRISGDVRAEIGNVLYELAGDFEDWFIEEKQGHFSTTFGEVFSFERSNEDSIGKKLILQADVKRGRAIAAR